MKINKLFFASLAVLATLVGCKEKEEAPLAPFLSLDKTEVELGKDGGSVTIALTTNRDWTATPSAEWIAVEPESGSASDDAQSVTITVLPNTGNNRTASVSFSIGLAKKSVSVSQLGEGGSLEDATVYKNDFDKEVAEKTYGTSSSSWPFLDQFDGWKNAAGTGVGSETYAYSGLSVRANSSSNGGYSDYDGSGSNNLFFGSKAYFAVQGIALPENTNYTLSFGSEKYTQDGSSLFVHSEFHVYISNDGAKWVELEYTFPNGDKEGTWDLASTTFTVPAGTSTLGIYVGADVASVYRLDDLSLMVSSKEGTVIDFSKGVDLGLGGSTGGNTPAAGAKGDGTESNPYNAIAANNIASALASGASTENEVYVAGIVSYVDDISAQYGNATYYISEDGTRTSEFEIFRGKYLNGESFTSEDQLKVGQKVLVLGKLTNYNGTPEMATGSKLISIEGEGVSGGDESNGSVTNPDGSITVSVAKSFLKDNYVNAKMDDVITYNCDTNLSGNVPTELRVYKGSNLKFTAAEGYTIMKVEFVTTANGNAKQGWCDGDTVTVDAGASAVVDFSDTSKNVAITVTGNTSSLNINAVANQIRITSLSVTYKAI